MTLSELTQTHGWKNFMAKLYGIGASVVIVGALFKIMHWPGAGLMLIAGLGTEAIIFFFSAFEPLHEEIDWTLVYPELAGIGDEDEINVPKNTKKGKETVTTSGNALAKFDEMLEKSGGSQLFEKLGTGLNNLTARVKDMSDISNAALATNEFSDSMKSAAKVVTNLSDTYQKSNGELTNATGLLSNAYKQSAESLNYSMDTLSDAFTTANKQVSDGNTNFVNAYKKLADNMNIDFNAFKDGNKAYSDNLSTLNKNLSALNAIFEMQLNEADLDKMMEDLAGSVEHSKKYNEQITKLGKQLEALNGIYGKMLTAMNYKVD